MKIHWKVTEQSIRSFSKILDLVCRLACDVEEKNYGRPERMDAIAHILAISGNYIWAEMLAGDRVVAMLEKKNDWIWDIL